MTEWDSERPDILGRKIQANIPPAIDASFRPPWWVYIVFFAPVIMLFLFLYFG